MYINYYLVNRCDDSSQMTWPWPYDLPYSYDYPDLTLDDIAKTWDRQSVKLSKMHDFIYSFRIVYSCQCVKAFEKTCRLVKDTKRLHWNPDRWNDACTCSDLGYVGALILGINNRKINLIMKRAARFVKYDIISQLPSEFFSHAVTSVFLPSVCRSICVGSHGVHWG